MFVEERIKLFVALGERLNSLTNDAKQELFVLAHNGNSWFTEESVKLALEGIGEFLKKDSLENWLSQYDLKEVSPKRIGVIAAGNIPLVGFHDVMTVLLSGHHLMIKPSSDDTFLMKYVLNLLGDIDSRIVERYSIVERLNEADAYIATGSDNSARYFKHYFKDKPNVIRANRTSVAVLTGEESPEELEALGQDVFKYFGLGCRNVSKLLIPSSFDLSRLLDTWEGYAAVGDHHKYRNNYDYNKSIYLVNREPHLDNGFVLLRESPDLVSPISVLYYSRFNSTADIEEFLANQKEKIQCVVGKNYIPFGQAQCPKVDDYADGVDTMAFLSSL
ncbi:acyl-CoA reductase [Reichenbachiella ulvae]|uniref:Acyl-CoA reductase n=1 Tax=Reichenbachiella ulvae TaxID=2980104 RepID=A0ABT3CQ19_9BACT|nr:acyl-CoA reductase [Reichenbachiella ulvae]MCV9385643.1 acyl-CoA reductase [Reichenbachiella ulvae]